jgi:hypothetical protein
VRIYEGVFSKEMAPKMDAAQTIPIPDLRGHKAAKGRSIRQCGTGFTMEPFELRLNF